VQRNVHDWHPTLKSQGRSALSDLMVDAVKWRVQVPSTMRLLVRVTRPLQRSCSMTRPSPLDVGHAEPDQGIGITGGGEHGLDLWQAGRGGADLVHIRRAGEAHLGEGLDALACLI